jgi:hypothetical protein
MWATMKQGLCLAAAVAALAAAPLADVWDVQTTNDNSNATENELVHGSDQLHDLGALGPTADQDWYRVGQDPFSSYEVTIDGVSGDVGPLPGLLQRVDNLGAPLQSSVDVAAGLGNAQALRFINNTASFVTDQYIRVANAACGTACGTDDAYRIRLRETTIRVARFNNSGTQITVLLIQNATDQPIEVRAHFWTTAGGQVATFSLPKPGAPLAPRALQVLNTATIAAGVGGHITIAHDGPHGAVNVKSVALEPATGFSFDTPGVYRP